jgi:hypothetical protein
MTLTQAIERKAQARRDWRSAPFSEKMAALIRMQQMAKEMAHASGRPFNGVVWKSDESRASGQ